MLFDATEWAPEKGPSNSTFRNLISPTLPVVTPGLHKGKPLPSLHSPHYLPDPSCIKTGVSAMTAAAMDLLQ